MSQGVQVEKVRFGVFEVDLRSGELRKHGIRIHLQRQPFKVLAALLERPGELVTREDLRQRIWGPEVVVDFDHSLGTAINKLREALCDSADTPQYVETLAKRGFRFIAPIEPIASPHSEPRIIAVTPPPSAVMVAAPDPMILPLPSAVQKPQHLLPWLAVLAALAAIAWWIVRTPAPPAVVRFQQITSDFHIYPGETQIERFPGVATDGVRVFFPDYQNGRVGLAYVLIGGGDVHPFLTPPEISRPSVADISRDGSEVLIRSLMWAETEQPIWIAPSTGGSARRFFDVLAHDAAWAPDGKSVLYASGQELFVLERSGGATKKLASLPGRAYWMRYSPDGSTIRFTVLDPKSRATSLWEMASDGRKPHAMLPGWSNPPAECCGDWASEGKVFTFQSSHSGRPNIWGMREAGLLSWSHSAPFQITDGPLSYFAPVPAMRGSKIFCIGANTRRELFHFSLASRKTEPYLSRVRGAGRSEHAHQTERVAWISTIDGSLWRGNEDGSERVQLIAPPVGVYMARWAPDDKSLLVMARRPGTPYQISILPADGGTLQPVLYENRNQADPDWGPGGKAIVFGRLPNYAAEDTAPKDIRVLDLASKTVSILPESAGMFSPRWSPDGRYIAAMTLDQHKLEVFDRSTSTWSTVAEGLIHNPEWSADGKQIYFQELQQDEVPIFRVPVAGGRPERILDRNISNFADSVQFWGLAPDGGPIGSFLFYGADMYSLSLPAR